MARFSTAHPEVRGLVDRLLVPGFIATNSVAALTRAIATLAHAAEGQPHPARLAALLTDDPSKGVNESTVELLRRADAANPWAGDGSVVRKLGDIGERARPHVAAGLTPAQIADLLSLPAAVVRTAVGDAPIVSVRPAGEGADVADWSFQDVAVERCLEMLRRRPYRNVGLVLPTGAGKTRTALRIILELLATAAPGTKAIWVTHRHLLREQAARELARLVDDPPPGLPADSALLAERIVIAMVGEIQTLLDGDAPPALVVVDEAHHAAAPSYAPIFTSRRTSPVLLLTATPIRPDDKPIHIDDVAYTVTYRELAARKAILIPTFEALPVQTFEMTDETIRAIARSVADETATRFRKTLVVASRIDHVEALTQAIKDEIETRPAHPLRSSDVGFIHGARNSHMLGDDAMLAVFAKKPRAVLVSAQMLLEGFDDPTIDSVVITYRTESIIKLMQAAGRCVRRSPGKRHAWVLQADNPMLAYRFDERWLYQEISDRVRPRIEQLDFATTDDLVDLARAQMIRHNVAEGEAARALDMLAAIDPDDDPRLLFYGLPYFGRSDRFEEKAEWGVFVETRGNTEIMRRAFNRYCEISPEPPDPTEFLDELGPSMGLPEGRSRLKRDLTALLSAVYFARRETDETGGAAQDRRGYRPHGATTWLRYVTTRRRMRLPHGLAEFLSDCHNGKLIASTYLDDPGGLALVIKVAVPIGGHEAVLLDGEEAEALIRWLDALEASLRATDPAHQLTRLTSLLGEIPHPPLKPIHLRRCEPLIATAGRDRFIYKLKNAKE